MQGLGLGGNYGLGFRGSGFRVGLMRAEKFRESLAGTKPRGPHPQTSRPKALSP